MNTIKQLAWIFALGLACQPALSAHPYEERKTSIKCGEIEATVVMRCKPGNTPDAFTPGHCITPGKLLLTSLNQSKNIYAAPDISASEKSEFQKNGVLSTLYPRTLACLRKNDAEYLKIDYYGYKIQSGGNSHTEFYATSGRVRGEQAVKKAWEMFDHNTPDASTFVDLAEGIQP